MTSRSRGWGAALIHGWPMFATVRRYAELSDSFVGALLHRGADIAAVLASVPGVTEAQLVRTRDGLILVTVGIDEPCLVESGRRFRAWVETHVPGFPPANDADIWVGAVVLQVAAGDATRGPEAGRSQPAG